MTTLTTTTRPSRENTPRPVPWRRMVWVTRLMATFNAGLCRLAAGPRGSHRRRGGLAGPPPGRLDTV
jgi:hypothetical protein